MLGRRDTRARGDDARRLRERLAGAGLVAGRRDPRRRSGEPGAGARLRSLLEGLGTVAALFGRYLATRADLLSLDDCAELARTALPVAPLPAGVVGRRIAAELRRPVGEVLASLDETPERVSAFHQWHAARLGGGEAVVLVLLRPEWDMPPDAAWLRGLEAALPGAAAAADDFARSLARRCDLEREARDLERLAERVGTLDSFVVPRVFASLSTPRLLVRASLEGRPLAAPCPGEPGAAHARDDARRLCAAFFQQALLAGALLEEPEAADFRLLPGERVAVGDGPVRVLDDGPRRTLLEYVSAVAREEPDAACAALLRLARDGNDGLDRDALRSRLRQAEPLRAGLGFERYQGRRLAHVLGVQWRLARECGCLLQAESVALARATLALDRIAAGLAPAHDAPAEGLGDVRLVAAAVELRELLAPSRLTANVVRYLPPLVELVQRADRLAQGGERRARPAPEPASRRALWAHIALVATVALVAPRLLAALGQPLAERLAAVALLVAGALLLGFVRRAERPARRV